MSTFFKNRTIILLFGVMVVALLAIVLAIYFLNKERIISTQKNKEVVVKLIDEVWSKNNLKIVDQLIAPKYTIKHDPGDPWEGKTLDLATYKKRVKMAYQVFPDQKFYIEDLVSDGDKVAVSWKFIGTQKGSIPGLPVTNKVVNVSGLTIYYFSNGKIVGHWQIVDRLGLFEQLGINKPKPD